MTIIVHHAIDPTFSGNAVKARQLWNAGGAYQKIAVVNTDDLNVAYEQTNNIEDLWVKNAMILETFNLVEVKGVKGARSTSMGDIMEKDGELYVVAMMGFEKI
jgi:predicted transcriptional regulator